MIDACKNALHVEDSTALLSMHEVNDMDASVKLHMEINVVSLPM